ncbi:kinetochore Sim4 complex subunit Fta2 [Aspergillus caelatus]|uniref:Kinetochore Sim4 complex subunit Fta2 n=1 Tax=Aspergillus caelatus TaxID=61420 RepID=A0A5N6ZVU1_9EURO|nr:kinetochore Sim4 complex subunit Fta2 [Aspergillus caelatus]KAE8361724.1 kinetochore Sim4 complex subunit Fta2 [Aspergillus caelatus]
MEDVQQGQQYQLLLNLFLSEEVLDLESTSDSSINNLDELVKKMPMLKRFIGYEYKIIEPAFIDQGQQGFVFRFRYNGRDLCLKLFYEYTAPYDAEHVAFTSPFGCESRAFARLCDMHENGHWAVRCHGWMCLTDSQLQQLWEVSGRVRYDPNWYRARWAIVKDFIADEPPSPEEKGFESIISNFCIPKRGRILPRDVKKSNYRGDRIVDLGSTITFPFYRRYASWTDFTDFFSDFDTNELPLWDRDM